MNSWKFLEIWWERRSWIIYQQTDASIHLRFRAKPIECYAWHIKYSIESTKRNKSSDTLFNYFLHNVSEVKFLELTLIFFYPSTPWSSIPNQCVTEKCRDPFDCSPPSLTSMCLPLNVTYQCQNSDATRVH